MGIRITRRQDSPRCCDCQRYRVETERKWIPSREMIEAIEEDYEGHVHLAVVLDDDPGRDLGMLRQPGHRFFFSVEEVEPLSQNANEERD